MPSLTPFSATPNIINDDGLYDLIYPIKDNSDLILKRKVNVER